MLGHLCGGPPPPFTASSPLAALVEGRCAAMAMWPNLLTTTPRPEVLLPSSAPRLAPDPQLVQRLY